MIYIYGLKCPIAGVIRYVGKSENPAKRLSGHFSGARSGQYNHHAARWLRKIIAQGLKPELVILHAVADGERWRDVERGFIKSAGKHGWDLTNSTAGGEGLDFIDPVAKAQYLSNLSAALKKVWSTPERRQLASERSLKAWGDLDKKKKRLEDRIARLAQPEARAKARQVLLETVARPDVQKKKADSLKVNWTDPNVRKKRAAAIDHAKPKMSASAKARWADPEERHKILAQRQSDAARALLSEKAKARSTPEYRAMMAEKTRLSWEKRRK